MRKPLRIGFDLDGVLADFRTNLYKLAIEKYGNTSVESLLSTEASILDSENNAFWEGLRPIDITRSIISKYVHSPIDYRYFITRRPPCTHAASIVWLRRHFNFGNNDVLISGAVEKGQIVAGLYLDRYFDDDPIHLIQVAKLSEKTIPYLIDQPHNQWFDTERWGREHFELNHYGIPRVK